MKIGIYGYGNLGKGVESAIAQNEDMELVGVFSRRKPESVKINTQGVSVYPADQVEQFREKIDVLIICGSSAADLPVMTPTLASSFNVIDSFDTHAKVPEHFANVDKAAKEGRNVAIISVGWDPGMFSLNRIYANAYLPVGSDYTFWGKGVSQGHSDAIRKIDGVLDAKQYTIPVEEAIQKVRSGENPELSTKDKHIRECFVVAKDGADLKKIETQIVTMPNYFADYNTIVHFVTSEELEREHSGIPHGGYVFRSGRTGFNEENNEMIEYSIRLDSNPEFTGSILVSYARAAYKMSKRGDLGCKTVVDVAPSDLLNMDNAEILKKFI